MSPSHETTRAGNVLPEAPYATGGNEEQEPCPAPLAWREVLNAYRTEADHWELRRGEFILRGRTWGNGPPVFHVLEQRLR